MPVKVFTDAFARDLLQRPEIRAAAPVRSYFADLHGQRVKVNVYALPVSRDPPPKRVYPRGRPNEYIVDNTVYASLPSTLGATEKGGRSRAPARVDDMCA